MKNAKVWIALVALILVVGLMAGIYIATRQQPDTAEPKESGSAPSESQSGPSFAHSFTLVVVHGNGSEKTVEIQTNREFLAEALLDEGLIVESDSPGMYNTVDGETADYNKDQSWWKFKINGEDAMEGMNTTRIQNGATYKLEYTIGW